MNPAEYEYQSDFAKRYVAEGRAEGKAEGKVEGLAEGQAKGKAEVLVKLLTLRFGVPSADLQARLLSKSSAELDAMAERVLTAKSIEEVLGNSH